MLNSPFLLYRLLREEAQRGMADTEKSDGVAAKVPAAAEPLAEEPSAIASNINYHAHYSPHFSPFKFEPEQAYYATAESVRDRLVQVNRISQPSFAGFV